jgi:hypothetical protein
MIDFPDGISPINSSTIAAIPPKDRPVVQAIRIASGISGNFMMSFL